MIKVWTIHPTDLQNVNITLRILFRPVTNQLPRIFTSIGEDYDERVLPSITTEVLKAVVVSNSPLKVKQIGWMYNEQSQKALNVSLSLSLSG